MFYIHAVRFRLTNGPARGPTLSVAITLLLLFFIQGLFFIRSNSQTFDEAIHLAAGYSYLVRRDFRLNSEHPPLIKQLQALPLLIIHRLRFNPDPQHWRENNGYKIGYDFVYKSALTADRIMALGRLPNLFLGASVIIIIGRWAHRLWGSRAALSAMALACLDPNLIAHSSLVTTDIGLTLFMFLSLYLFWEYINSPKWWLLLGTGISAGMALVSKFSALLLIPMLALIVALCVLSGAKNHVGFPPTQSQSQGRHKILQTAQLLSVIFFCAVLTIPSAYFFEGYKPWLSGLQWARTMTEPGRSMFFLGDYSYEGWWSYFLVAFLIKTPVGTLVLIFASLALWRAGSPHTRHEAIFLILPAALFFVATTQAAVNIGLRHILPVYPFLFVLASRLATLRFKRRFLAAFLVFAPLLLTAISSFRTAPHQLAYFNEIIGGPDQGHRYLSDSNIDWGQDLKGLKAYVDREELSVIYLSYFGTAPPSYYGIRYQYVPGFWPLEWPPPPNKVPANASRKILAISVYNLQDVSSPYDPLFRWLWVRKPVAKIGYSIFVYDLTDDREGLLKLEEAYVKAGIKIPR